MNISSLIIWGLIATAALSTLLSFSRPLGYTRMDLPFMLGTMVTSKRNNAPSIGFFLHLMMGWIFAFLYGCAFETSGINSWWFGMLLGIIHGTFVLSVGLEILNYIHPRMANPFHGPTPTKNLEPPGFLALNYGRGTPLVTLIGHMIYGTILALFYTPF